MVTGCSKRTMLLLSIALVSTTVLFITLGFYKTDKLNFARPALATVFSWGKSKVDGVAGEGKTIIKSVGPPYKKTQSQDSEVDGGRHKLVVSRGGKTREYYMRGVVWRDYQDIGGVASILGAPVGNEYNWCNGKRQDFERGHWLYWSEETGVKMDYTPLIWPKIRKVNSFQAPIFNQGKPAVEWSYWSFDKYFITQDFGVNGHLGQDLAIGGELNPGYEIRAVANGKVILTGWTGSNAWGYMVLIQHSLDNGRRYYSQYAHLYGLPFVSEGQVVSKETVLGRVGSTGKSTGPHLDLQIKEIPNLNDKLNKVLTLSDIGPGYAEQRIPFSGNIRYDFRTGITYYKPSEFIRKPSDFILGQANGSLQAGNQPLDQTTADYGNVSVRENY